MPQVSFELCVHLVSEEILSRRKNKPREPYAVIPLYGNTSEDDELILASME